MKAKPLSPNDQNRRLRDFRNSTGLVEARLWVKPAKKEQLEMQYPKPRINEEFKRRWKK